MKRDTDGKQFWSPNPAPPTWGAGDPQPAPADWVAGFLDFYGVRAPEDKTADPKRDCLFNSDQTPISDVVSTADAQARLAGYSPSSLVQYAVARKIDDDLGGQQEEADKKESGDLAAAIVQQLKDGLSIRDELTQLLALNMDKMLRVMDALKSAGVLDDFDARVGANADPRIVAAIRTIVAPPFTFEWRTSVRALSDADKAAIVRRIPREEADALDGQADDDTKEAERRKNQQPDAGPSNVIIGIMFVPNQKDDPLIGPKGEPKKESTENPQIQWQGQYTFKFVNTKFHFEESLVCQGGFSKDSNTNRVQFQPMAGAQVTAVRKLFDQLVLQGFGQVLAGATLALNVPVNAAPITATQISPTGQLAVGVQAVFTIPGTNIQLVLQAQASITGSGNTVALNRSTGLGLQVQF